MCVEVNHLNRNSTIYSFSRVISLREWQWNDSLNPISSGKPKASIETLIKVNSQQNTKFVIKTKTHTHTYTHTYSRNLFSLSEKGKSKSKCEVIQIRLYLTVTAERSSMTHVLILSKLCQNICCKLCNLQTIRYDYSHEMRDFKQY
jgi:hypothetical protein